MGGYRRFCGGAGAQVQAVEADHRYALGDVHLMHVGRQAVRLLQPDEEGQRHGRPEPRQLAPPRASNDPSPCAQAKGPTIAAVQGARSGSGSGSGLARARCAVCEARRARGRVGAGQRRRLTSPLITPRKSVAVGGTGAGTLSRTALPALALSCSRSSSSRSVPGCEAMRSPSAPHSCALALPSTPPERKDETSRRSWSWSHAWYQLTSRQETGEVG